MHFEAGAIPIKVKATFDAEFPPDSPLNRDQQHADVDSAGWVCTGCPHNAAECCGCGSHRLAKKEA